MAEIKVPELAESITEGTIAQFLKEPGEYVNQGENIAELETDKVNVEVTAEQSGVIQKFLKEAGDTVEVGDAIAVVDENADSSSSDSSAGETEAKEAPKEEAKPAEESSSSEESDDVEADDSGEKPVASPAARKLAREKGIDLNAVPVRDPLGRVRTEDVENYEQNKEKASAPKQKEEKKQDSKPKEKDEFEGKPVVRERMSRRRQTIANRLVEAQQTSAMLTTFNEIDMSAVMELRKRRKDRFQEMHDVRLGFMSFFTKAVIGALKQYPYLNAEIQGSEIVRKQFYDIGMAVSTEEGLIVPVVRDADKKTFADIEQEVVDLSKKAQNNQLQISDLQGGSFTITNGGVFGSLLSTPILNTPQVGILGMHKIQWRPVAIDEENMENRPMMYIALSYDHRIVDGKEAVSFLVKVKELLEEPENLLLEG
ncbi:2-oxoglutarate dehydrogenase E2 component [Salsuginibacillus halophilus]|uniref:Dihydrolipoyllysine-residue succinyltransferase component of 2-oxoglutarate dehydrogenase complex n=1 Tax=Salsuginibacillus halophilus TaxID=517424 RepID=A0A2P8HWK8_9BACI|nr:2-oxoglutarate dehydrogenase complex dihydrolipoyllysine-residue succinyltransferase [Salsuginibacillus halophilus]PSL50607.1 2-oxoglutarate dehydrogenase E2 component [Salsuginibacillus halophilus]